MSGQAKLLSLFILRFIFKGGTFSLQNFNITKKKKSEIRASVKISRKHQKVLPRIAAFGEI